MPERMADELHELAEAIQGLRKDAKAVREELQRSKRIQYALAVISILVIVALIVTGIALSREANDRKAASDREQAARVRTQQIIKCFEDWSVKFTNRSDKIIKISNSRTNALDKVVRDAFTHPGDRALLQRDGQAYLKASDEFSKAVRNNPYPDPPTITCDLPR